MNQKILFIYLLSTILLPPLTAQQSSITIVDENSREACSYANVILTDLDNNTLTGGVSDENGCITFTHDQKAIVVVSYLGYESTHDTISPGADITILLKTSSYEMEQVVVTGQYTPKPVDKSIYRIDVVDSRSMRERGVNNLAEALAAETSIRLKIDPSTGSHITMQGMGGENIKYLIDGIPLVGRVRGEIDLSQIDMENVDHIEIVHGPMAVQYGSGAIAGVINIITKRNSYFRNLLKVNSFTDTKGTYNFGFFTSALRKKHSLDFSINRNIFQGYDVNPSDRYMTFKPKLVYNSNLSYSYRKNDLNIDIKSHFMNMELRDYANYIDKIAIAYDNFYFTHRSTNTLTIKDRISESINYDLTFSYTWYGREVHDITSDLFLLTKETTSIEKTRFHNYMTRSSLVIVPEEKKWSALTGWDINYDKGSGERMEEEASIGDFVWYASGQYSPIQSLTIQPGIRLIYNTDYGAPFVPSLNFQWSFAENFSFRTSYAKGFRAPSLKELYIDFKDSNHNIYGNKDLSAEYTNSYNLSIDHHLVLNDISLKNDVSLYYNDGKDVISLIVTDISNNSATYDNIDERKTYGGEYNISFNWKSQASAGIGFSRTGESYFDQEKGLFLEPIFYNNFSLDTRYTIKPIQTVLYANLKYYGKTPFLIEDEETNELIRKYHSAYGDLEFSVSRSFWKKKINFVFGGKNLLNVYEIITIGEQLEYNPKYYGRTWYLKMNLKLSK